MGHRHNYYFVGARVEAIDDQIVQPLHLTLERLASAEAAGDRS
jgi:hypothetical protein